MKVRKSNRPQKQLLFYWLAQEFKRSAGRKQALDFACGNMLFRPAIRAEEYFGIDLDPERIDTGLRKFPEVRGLVSPILDAPEGLIGDYVVCIETIGINNHFEPAQTLQTVEKLVSSTQKGGDTLFNIGPLSAEFVPQIAKFVEEAYEDVVIYRYGAFNEIRHRRFARPLAKAMLAVPLLRTLGPQKRYLFSCRNKMY